MRRQTRRSRIRGGHPAWLTRAAAEGMLLMAPCQAALTNMSALPDYRKSLPVKWIDRCSRGSWRHWQNQDIGENRRNGKLASIVWYVAIAHPVCVPKVDSSTPAKNWLPPNDIQRDNGTTRRKATAALFSVDVCAVGTRRAPPLLALWACCWAKRSPKSNSAQN